MWCGVTFTVPAVNGGFFPLDEQLHLWGQRWSERLAKQAVWLLGQVTGTTAETILREIGGLAVSDSSLWRRLDTWGERIKAQEMLRSASAIQPPTRSEIQPGETHTSTDMGVALDGAMINVRAEGWKELKVGSVFDIEVRAEPEPETGEVEDRAHAVRTSYVAHLGGPEKFGNLLWGEAQRRGWNRARDHQVLGDGANWIWNLAGVHFSDSRQVVDWYHGKAHLYRAGHLAWGEGSAEAGRWAKAMETPLYQGHAWKVAATVRELAEEFPGSGKELRSEAGYFESNKRRMQYLELREEGFLIGSGMVESGCKQFRARFTGAGMRWSRAGAERLIPVRAAILSDRFEEVWQGAYKSPLN
jgi:hypothetical protein